MKTFVKYFLWSFLCVFTIIACDSLENNDDESLKNGKHICKMLFQGTVNGYEGTTVRDAGTKGESTWSDGDMVYIAFHNGDAIVSGTAEYSTSDGWMVSYDGDLANGASQRCEVRFFVNTTFANENLVTLNSNTEIYEDSEGTFNYSDGYITVNATLVPKVGRIRFTGNANDQIYINGITNYSTFSPAGNRFSTTTAMIPLTVNASGSTPYVYGYFTYEDRKLGVVGSDFAYTRNCSTTVLQTSDSGYMKIPSKTSHNNWKTGLIIPVNGVDFKMLPVAGYSGGFFLLAETETTNAQYKAISGTGTEDSYPYVTYLEAWRSLVSTLNYATGLSFYIPSLEEWRFAAIGGSLSQGYTYSGSNTPGDVAWYAGNSGGAKHEVKKLTPNELGFYDMSGNVREWTSTRHGSGPYYYACGGDYQSPESEIESYSGGTYDSGSSYGLRFALKLE
jgi:hypothetical protein